MSEGAVAKLMPAALGAGGDEWENISDTDRFESDAKALQQDNPIAAASMGYLALLVENGETIDEHQQLAAAGALALAQ